MQLGEFNIGREQMPSYDDFRNNPTHLTQLKQERLQKLLAANNMMQMQQAQIPQTQPTSGGVQQTSRAQEVK